MDRLGYLGDGRPSRSSSSKARYGDVERDGKTYRGVCLTCLGESGFHPGWLVVRDRARHDEGHVDWLDLDDDAKNCRVADALAGKMREQRPDGSWRTLTGDDLRFA